MSATVTVVDHGVGNLGSVINMLKKVGVPHVLSTGPKDIERAEKIILPGVGAFDGAMRALKTGGYYDVLNEKVVREKTPILGICLGMQLLARSSEEGSEQGFGWIPASVKRFSFGSNDERLKIPHMGWNTIRVVNDSPLIGILRDEPDVRFYFVHSYYVVCDDAADQIAVTPYNGEFTSIMGKGNVFGAQFHPEKSHKFGMQLFRNFAALAKE